MCFDFSGRTYIVFGATGGIGYEIARYLSNDCNANVVLMGRDEGKLKNVSADIKNVITSVSLDVANEHNVRDAFQILRNDTNVRSLCVGGLVYAIGTAPLQKISELNIKVGMDAYRINALGFAHCISEYLRYFSMENSLSSIVAISSVVGKATTYRQSDYAASKAGLDQYVRFAAKEYMGVARINSISPGVVETGMYRALTLQSENLAGKTLKKQPLGIIDPICVAEMAAYLLSDSARYMTGSDIVMDAGFGVML